MVIPNRLYSTLAYKTCYWLNIKMLTLKIVKKIKYRIWSIHLKQFHNYIERKKKKLNTNSLLGKIVIANIFGNELWNVYYIARLWIASYCYFNSSSGRRRAVETFATYFVCHRDNNTNNCEKINGTEKPSQCGAYFSVWRCMPFLRCQTPMRRIPSKHRHTSFHLQRIRHTAPYHWRFCSSWNFETEENYWRINFCDDIASFWLCAIYVIVCATV